MSIDWDRIGSEYHDVTRVRQLCDRVAAERDAALALLREIRETHFIALPLLSRIDRALAEVTT